MTQRIRYKNVDVQTESVGTSTEVAKRFGPTELKITVTFY